MGQTGLIPVVIVLNYNGYFTMKFPVNPESLKRTIPSSSESVRVYGLGEVSVPKTPDLATMTIETFLWQEQNLVPNIMYINWLKKWQKSKEPAKMIVSKLGYSMYVTCEGFSYETRAGEEDDYYITLDLKEYRAYGARRLGLSISAVDVYQKAIDVEEAITSPILVEIPRPARCASYKQLPQNPYMVGAVANTIAAIVKRIKNSDDTKLCDEFYQVNKKKLLANLDVGDVIPEGTELIIPDEWGVT